jgi:acetate CoA/acetoacetate CoA-transferase beta subunit
MAATGLAIIAMTHTARGKTKIVRECTLLLTSARPVDRVVTEMAVLKSSDQELVLKELAPGVSVDDVVQNTEAELIIPAEVPEMPEMPEMPTAA